MKKTLAVILPLFCAFVLSACSHGDSVNLLFFTDNFNKIRKNENQVVSEYTVNGNTFSTVLKSGKSEALLSLEEDENGRIKTARLTLSKINENAQPKNISETEADFFKNTAAEMLYAFTFFESKKCQAILSQLLPETSTGFHKTGELNTQSENFFLVYYSNKICCQLFVTNTYLEEIEPTKKPENKIKD